MPSLLWYLVPPAVLDAASPSVWGTCFSFKLKRRMGRWFGIEPKSGESQSPMLNRCTITAIWWSISESNRCLRRAKPLFSRWTNAPVKMGTRCLLWYYQTSVGCQACPQRFELWSRGLEPLMLPLHHGHIIWWMTITEFCYISVCIFIFICVLCGKHIH